MGVGMKKFPFGWLSGTACVVFMLVLEVAPEDGQKHLFLGITMVTSLVICVVSFVGFAIQVFVLNRKELAEQQRIAKAQRGIERGKKIAEQQEQVLDNLPVEAVLVSTTEQQRKGVLGTVARGTLGYLTFGEFGAAVGVTASMSKARKQQATFSVKYASGRKGLETVDVESKRFRELDGLLMK